MSEIHIYTTSEIRNVAIIAHVDHGKTTLVDALLQQSGTFRSNEQVVERVMDSNDLEKERGITILAKCTAVEWGGKKINIIDTPGHADFGGEVERVLSMVDSAILLVDSSEGVMPQTKFVLSKALGLGLKPIVVINKIDRPDERIKEVLEEILELFMSLDATDEQLDFPVLYASGRNGYAMDSLNDEKKDLTPLFSKIVSYVPQPNANPEGPFKFLATILEVDNFMGRTLTGKIYSGQAKFNAQVKVLNIKGEVVERGRITRLQTFSGVKRNPVETANAGDIVTIAGLGKMSVADTITIEEVNEPVPSYPIDPPTMSVTISVNTSPFAGKDGDKLTSTVIKERLMKESERNIAIGVKESDEKDSFEVSGRGELQLGVLLETMRREGFEISVSRPKVIFKKDDNDKLLEPIEEVVVDVDEEYSGSVVEKIGLRRGEMKDMRQSSGGKMRIIFHVPSRGLIGYRNEFLTDTRGTGVLNRIFHAYEPHRGEVKRYRNGVLIATDTGVAVAYAIFNLQERGIMFIRPQDEVYEGMIVGENSRDSDMTINVLKGKQLTNVRSSGTDEAIKLVPAKIMTLEEMISYVADDELIEITPKNLRLRKRYLNPNDRKRMERKGDQAS
jgi:GTP-binding protein